MNLESAIKFHSPKSPNYTATTPATASEALTGTDVMAAMGMAQSRAEMGYSAFLGKMGISKHDSDRAITLLTQHALQTCDRVAALRKLGSDSKPAVMQVLATYAYLDYCRSAASVKSCECCSGAGFLDAEVFTMKSPLAGGIKRNVREVVRVRCKPCEGRGVVSASCNDCSGRGRALDRKQTEAQGVPVMGDCKRCSGRGYERIPSTEAHRATCNVTEEISLDTWKKSVKPFYDSLITKLEIEEAWANCSLSKVTA
ncbi:antitermination protein [Duffyella gerundensis]|uniref:antitermination protein n=1 Tax=Duffyella gerundensis TaxID=1619313 RepID=UPI0021F75F25|nr:antitermination protein [Duffyella gerundensis]